MIVPCLSVRPPWAQFITRLPRELAKNVENRSRRTKFRGTFLVHASKGCTRAEYDDACDFARSFADIAEESLPTFEQLERGGIIGAVRLVNVLAPGDTEYAWHDPDSFGYELEGHTPLPFRPYRGSLGWFRVELTATEEAALRLNGLL